MRWYDKYEKLGKHIDSLKEMPEERRDRRIKGIMRLIKREYPTLLDDFVQEFPLDIHRRRWYDKDPYLWLIINGLQFADEELRLKVVEIFDAENEKDGAD